MKLKTSFLSALSLSLILCSSVSFADSYSMDVASKVHEITSGLITYSEKLSSANMDALKGTFIEVGYNMNRFGGKYAYAAYSDTEDCPIFYNEKTNTTDYGEQKPDLRFCSHHAKHLSMMNEPENSKESIATYYSLAFKGMEEEVAEKINQLRTRSAFKLIALNISLARGTWLPAYAEFKVYIGGMIRSKNDNHYNCRAYWDAATSKMNPFICRTYTPARGEY